MKRNLSLFDGLALLMLYFKLSGTGPDVTWLMVVAPYMVEVVVVILLYIGTLFSWSEKIRFFIFKKIIAIRSKAAGKKASKNINDLYNNAKNRSANPGQYHDPVKTGK